MACAAAADCFDCVGLNSNGTDACVYCDGACVRAVLDDADAQWIVTECFDGTPPLRTSEACAASILPTPTSPTTAITALLTTTTTRLVVSSSSSSAVVPAPVEGLDSTALTITVVVSVVVVLCLIGALWLAACWLRRARALGASDADENVGLFDELEEEEAARDRRSLPSSPVATNLAVDVLEPDDPDDMSMGASTMLFEAPRAMHDLDLLMAELNDGANADSASENELAWRPVLGDDPVKRISATVIKGAPQFHRKPSIRASLSKAASNRALARTASRKLSDRDLASRSGSSKPAPRSALRREPTPLDDLRPDDELDAPALPPVESSLPSLQGLSYDDDHDHEDSDAPDDALPDVPNNEPRPGQLFLAAVEASHLAASGGAVKRVAKAVYTAVQRAKSAEDNAMAAGDKATAKAIRQQMSDVALTVKGYSTSPSKVTAGAIVDALTRLVTLSVAYDAPEDDDDDERSEETI